ncbi:ATP-binding cassette long-chain fatty acid transporter pxa2, partial [Coemansia sp. RSA 2703]
MVAALNSEHLVRLLAKKMHRYTHDFQHRQLATLLRLVTLYARYRKPIRRTIAALIGVLLIERVHRMVRLMTSQRTQKQQAADGQPRRGAQLDRRFFDNLRRLVAIAVPHAVSTEGGMLAVHTVLLVFRTFLSVAVAALDGQIVSALVRLQGGEFLRGIVRWMAMAVPATLTNSLLTYLQTTLALRFRQNLTAHVHAKYLQGTTYYAVGNLDDRIANADQLIAVDVRKFSDSLAALYSNLAKPTLDALVYNVQLMRSLGAESLFGILLVIQASMAMLRVLAPPFGQLVAQEQRLEGDFHFAHARLIEHAEEVALYRGHEAEKRTLTRRYLRLVRHVSRVVRLNVFYGMLEDFVVKYFWGAAGLVACAAPVFASRIPGASQPAAAADLGSRTRDFITNRRLLLSGSDALGRMMYSYKEVVELAGFTERVADLLAVLDDVNAGRYVKTKVGSAAQAHEGSHGADIVMQRGRLVESPDDVEFIGVPIVSPNGDVLVRSLSFHVTPGRHLLIVGPNGCGKSSMFRILGGLWPVYAGTLRKPSMRQIFYIPQRPYLPIGTLRDQLIYPDSAFDMRTRGVTDDQLLGFLDVVQMRHVVDREGGWDAVKPWRDALSGGDKQRIAMARL